MTRREHASTSGLSCGSGLVASQRDLRDQEELEPQQSTAGQCWEPQDKAITNSVSHSRCFVSACHNLEPVAFCPETGVPITCSTGSKPSDYRELTLFCIRVLRLYELCQCRILGSQPSSQSVFSSLQASVLYSLFDRQRFCAAFGIHYSRTRLSIGSTYEHWEFLFACSYWLRFQGLLMRSTKTSW